MAISGGDPLMLAKTATTLPRLGNDLGHIARDVRSATTTAADGAGDPDLAAALDRFTAAWAGELVACSCAAQTLGSAADVNAEQLRVATGGR